MTDEDGDSLNYYWWSRFVYGLMTNLHCGERDVLAMRYDRALAYLAEINIDLGNPVSRPEPDLPEEEEVRRVMREEYAKEHPHYGDIKPHH